MPSSASPPFRHRPYDGSSQPFTVGLKPIGEESWLEPDTFLDLHLEEKERLFARDLPAVFRAGKDTDAAQAEVLELVVEHLKRCHEAEQLLEVVPYVSRTALTPIEMTA